MGPHNKSIPKRGGACAEMPSLDPPMILRAEATKIMAPSATCTNQWAWLAAGEHGTESELTVRG